MKEYIEREAAVTVCSNQYKECLRKSDWCGDTVAWNICFNIKSIPAADVVERKRGEWISVKERLPKLHTEVLVYRGNLGGMGGYVSIDHMDVRWVDDEPMWSSDVLAWKSKVTHWMPLPEPPNCGADMRGEKNAVD